jgi:thiamine-phosphate pyrophosphorylase
MAHPFALPRFYPILDTAVLADRHIDVVRAAAILIDAGVEILQYRHKDPWTQREFDEAETLGRMCQSAGVLFVINDRADFAKLLGAALHLGQHDLPPIAARKVIGDEVIGFSTHNRAQLSLADEEPVEYLSIGPIFTTTSKAQPDPVVGLEKLKELRTVTRKPLCAIGGITLENARQTLAAGATSLAVISGWLPKAPSSGVSIKASIQEWLAVSRI